MEPLNDCTLDVAKGYIDSLDVLVKYVILPIMLDILS
jgi:hypothetical protein